MTSPVVTVRPAAGHYSGVGVQPFEHRIRYLGVSLERGTPNVPDDGMYYVLRGDEVYYKGPEETIARAYLEILVDETQAAHPEIKNPRDVLAKERGFNDILAVRGDARRRARAHHEAKGGKGGRGGV